MFLTLIKIIDAKPIKIIVLLGSSAHELYFVHLFFFFNGPQKMFLSIFAVCNTYDFDK